MTEELRARLPEQALDLLDSNDGRYSEWATASAVAMHCMNADFTDDEFVEVVSVSDFAYYFATEGGHNKDRHHLLDNRLRKVWDRAEEHWEPPLGSVGDVRKKLSELQSRVFEYRWAGRSGPTDRKVALALIEYGHSNGAWTLNMSARKLGELAGIGKNTASRSLNRLVKTGFLKRQVQDDDSPDETAASWSLCLDWRRDTTGTYKPLPPNRDYVYLVCPFEGHPVFLANALGPTAGRIYSDLPEEGSLTAAEIASSLRLNPKTARRNLDRLVSVGLATKSDGRPARYSLVSVSLDYLNELAEQYGTLDWHERQAKTHQQHREGYRVFRELREASQVPEPVAEEPSPTDEDRRYLEDHGVPF